MTSSTPSTSSTQSTLEIARELAVPTSSKIVLLVVDGLGGLPHPGTGRTELESADIPNLDRLAWGGDVGLTEPLAPGITVGSGPGHLALFGYDPLQFRLGRGASSALGIDFPLLPGDVVARINFATRNRQGLIVDRRAGRISDAEGQRLCGLLGSVKMDGVEIIVRPEKGHRALVVFRGEGLSNQLSDSDPQRQGVPVPAVQPLVPDAAHAAEVANSFVERAHEVLSGEKRANTVLLRGFSGLPDPPSMSEVFRLKPAAISAFPTYRGVARAVGMEILSTGDSFESEVEALEANFARHDFFYLHAKRTDSAGEDGLFHEKVRALESVDRLIPRLIALRPDVLAVAGDHSCPSVYGEHTWHPVPFLIRSRWSMPSRVSRFTERECVGGNLGIIPATRVILLLLAHAGKLRKFGA